MTELADRLEETPTDVEQAVTPLELFFDLVFVFAITQVTGFVSARPDVDAARRGAGHPHRAVVGVGVLRVAGQHRGLRRGDRARRAAVGHGRHAHRVAGRPARVRRRRGDLRRRLPGGARAASRGLRDRLARRSAAAPRRRADGDHDAAGLDADRRGGRSGRHRAGAHVGGGAGGRLRRPRRARHRGLARRGRPLLRAPRPGHHHRAGRVDRRRSASAPRGSASTRASSSARCWAWRSPRRCGGRTSTSSRWSPRACCARRRPPSRCASRATPTPTCTCRWWPGSCSSRWGSKKTLGHVGDELDAVPAVALCGGVALYLVALSALKRRNIGSFNCPRLVAAVAAGRCWRWWRR